MAVIIASVLTGGIAGLIWAFLYNKKYTTSLLEQGYVFADPDANKVRRAKEKLGVFDLPVAQ